MTDFDMAGFPGLDAMSNVLFLFQKSQADSGASNRNILRTMLAMELASMAAGGNAVARYETTSLRGQSEVEAA
jgi:hypothetical protein